MKNNFQLLLWTEICLCVESACRMRDSTSFNAQY